VVPTTPVAPYYAGFDRPFEPSIANTPHSSGPGGSWRDYAYGPGEADAVLVNVRPRRFAHGGGHRQHPARTGCCRRRTSLMPARRQECRAHTSDHPGVKIFISTNIAATAR